MLDDKWPSLPYVGAALGLCFFAGIGMWLPWVENTPQYLNGEPYVTGIGLPGLWWGYDSFDLLVAIGLVPALVGTLTFRRRIWLRDACVFLSGTLVSWWVGGLAYEYWSVDHYLLEPGIFLVLGSGLLFCLLSAGAVAKRLGPHVKRAAIPD